MSGLDEKARIRAVMARRRRGLDAGWIVAASRTAQDRILGLPEFMAATSVACYLALPGEVRTERILENCWMAGKTVSVPVFDPEAGGYRFCVLKQGAALARGPLGVSEPEIREAVGLARIGLVVMPGVAFDTSGGRLGRGGAYYDRLLRAEPGIRPPFRLGVAFDFQVVDCVPLEAHDVKADAVVTEERVIRCADGAA